MVIRNIQRQKSQTRVEFSRFNVNLTTVEFWYKFQRILYVGYIILLAVLDVHESNHNCKDMPKRINNVQKDTHDESPDKVIKLYSNPSFLDSDEDSEENDEKRDDDAESGDYTNGDEFEGEENFEETGDGKTPFNMQEELEEGYFDKNGYFIRFENREMRDNWLDNIDWCKVTQLNKKYSLNEDSTSDSELEESFQEAEAYEQILTYMESNETLLDAIKRFGKDSTKMSVEDGAKSDSLRKHKIYLLTELANKILHHTGNVDVYQQTYENISDKINNANKNKNMEHLEGTELDMFSSNFVSKEIGENEDSNAEVTQDNLEISRKVQWEFKWSQDNDKTEGPFSTEQMLKWSSEGYFNNGVLVKKYGEYGTFYRSNRIDFDLYI